MRGYFEQFGAGYVARESAGCLDVPRRAAAGLGRSAGVPALDPLTTAPAELGGSSDFSRANQSGPADAYWMIGVDLFLATGGQVLRDARAELAVPDSEMIWSRGLLDRAGAMARSRNPSVLLPPVPGPADVSVPSAWLKVVLWLTYSAAPVALSTVRFPVGVSLPEMGGAAWDDASGAVQVFRSFDPRLLARNPFATAYGPEIDVEGGGGGGGGGGGTPMPAPPSSGSSGGGALVALALLALGVAASSEGK